MKSVQRIISMILALSLILGTCPQKTWAEETETVPQTIAKTTAETISETVAETTVPVEAEAETEPEETTLYVEETMAKEIVSSDAVNDTAVLSGSCGKNVTWSLEDRVLTIRGTGAMTDYRDDSDENRAPWYTFREGITSVNIENGVSTIGTCAFYGCTALRSVTIPDSIIYIYSYSFYGCTTLTDITIPDNVYWIGDNVFHSCTSLKSITIPESVAAMGDYSFVDCSSLRSITLPESLISIGPFNFAGCTSLTNITLPDRITSIGSNAFSGCTSLNSITIPEGVTSIGQYTFNNCTNLTSITIPASITSIEYNAFANCSNIADVYITDLAAWCSMKFASYANPLRYGANLHLNGQLLTDCVIPMGVTSIGDDLFSGCTSLTRVTLPSSVLSIGDDAFAGCPNLVSVTVPVGVTSIGAGAFARCTSLKSITIPEGVTSIGASAFASCSSLAKVTIPDSVTSVGNYLFNRCTKLYKVNLGNGITTIGEQMFSLCENLTHITLPDSITSIDQWAFSWCYNLTSITIPEGTVSVGDYAFNYCESLSWIAIPVSVTTMSTMAFSNSKLSDVYYGGTQEQWKANRLGAYGTIHFSSSGPDDMYEELPPAYDTKTELTPGTAATPELNILLDYLIDWLTAYEQWVASVKEGLEDFGAGKEESKENIIRQEAERMRTHDQNTHSRYLTGQIEGYESQAYHALASFFYENIATEVPDISSVDLEKDLAGVNLVEMLRKNMYGSSDSYFYGNVTISICVFRSLSVNFGSMTIIDNKGSPTGVDDVMRTITICSDSNQIQQALTTYVGELQDLSINASFNIANAVVKDILGKSLTTLTSDYVNKAVAKIETKLVIKLVEKLGAAGVGKNLVSTLDECYTFYTWVKKCIDLGKQEDIDKALNNIINLKFEDTTVSKGVTKKAMKQLRKAHSKMQRALREYLDGTIVEKEQGFWRWFFGCPVSISVYNSSDEQIGYVGEDDLWYTDDISITELGGVKEIVSFTEDELSFVVTATDYGTMSCMFEQYDEDFAPVGRLNYYNVILEPEQTFQVSVPETLEEENETAAITSGGEVIYPDEYISAEDSAGVTISCSAVTEDGITGGTVSGTGTYIRGDSVILRAEPYEGFRFVGWFDGEYLMGTETIYEFPARENCEISARFYKQKPILIQLEADVGGGAIGGGRYDSGETVTLIALPQSGYRFDGWYVGEELVSTDEEYSFQAAESLILHAAFLHTAVKGDLNEDGAADIQDAIYLIWNTLFPDLYPVTADADFNNDGIRNSDDAVILLWHTLFPEQYPLP